MNSEKVERNRVERPAKFYRDTPDVARSSSDYYQVLDIETILNRIKGWSLADIESSTESDEELMKKTAKKP